MSRKGVTEVKEVSRTAKVVPGLTLNLLGFPDFVYPGGLWKILLRRPSSVYGLTDGERATALLNMRGLGDSKPSELMDNMLSLLGQHQPCFIFRQIFLQQLPERVRTPLFVLNVSDYRALAREADKLFLAGRHNEFHASQNIAQCTDSGPQEDAICWYHRKHHRQHGPPLQAANGTSISTYGSRTVSLRFNETTYDARLIIAVVKRPLLGADFFRRHNLLVDLNGQRLIDADTYLSCPCSTSRVAKTELAPIEHDSNKFRKVLQEFPALLQPTFTSATVKHGVQHHICTTGPPVHSRARRLAPDRLTAAKKEFIEMEQSGIIRKQTAPGPHHFTS
ncbi:retrovirus-related Pol polyprotein [Elysia marginata]|uniref:Retrovirus-related Pol polyprotein n=1 Tax=Elysia marginata TaxID=1093978 RepID=A0AAV4IDH0_9GAST|nr:retrovirus-related Pol polyprotein [Elysia marginata]